MSISFVGCQKIWMEENPENNPKEIFESMWNEIDQNYVFFDLKNIDWTQVYNKYEAQINDDMSEQALFEVLSKMLSELKDGHVSLYAGFNTWLNTSFYLESPSNFNKNFVEQTYLGSANRIGPFVYKILDGNIGYIYYESFGRDFTSEELDFLVDYMSTTKGLILDIRDNVGGATDNVTALISYLISEKIEFGSLWSPSIKGGSLDIESTIEVTPKEINYKNPIALLVNRKCYSSANLFAGFMSTLPNVNLIGDTTGGGSGFAVASELSNGWRYRYSGAKILLKDGSELEMGVSPDIHVVTGAEDELLHKDQLIEKAMFMLK